MANARGEPVNRHGKRKKNPVTVSGPWFPMPLDFLRSRAWSELSVHGVRMLLDLCSNLGPNASGNGDLSAAPAIMHPKGWRSTATRVAALDELERAGLIAVTKRGNRRACTLYAVTLWPLQCDFSKLDHGPGTFTTSDWTKAGIDRAERPTCKTPATWRPLRKNEIALPATGQPAPDMHPPRDNLRRLKGSFVPATGTKKAVSGLGVLPPRDTFLDKPSAGVVGCAGVRPGHAGSGIDGADETLRAAGLGMHMAERHGPTSCGGDRTHTG